MSSGGMNRKSAEAHKLAGTFKKSRHNGMALTAPEGVPPKPESLTGVASDEWDRMIERLMATRTLTASDGPCILNYSQLAALGTRLQSELDELPSVQYPKLVAGVASCEPAVHPLVSQLVRVRSALRLYLTELGLTPSSRDRVSPTKGLMTEDDLAKAEERRRFFGPR